MALKVLMLRKKLSDAQKALETLRAKDAEFETREADLAQSIEEASTDEERSAVDEAITAFESEKAEHETAKGELERTISEIENTIAEEEAAQDTDPAPAPAPVKERKVEVNMNTRSKIFGNMDIQTRTAMFEHEDVKNYLAEVRSCISQKRALTNVGLTIPEVFLGLLRENIMDYSKLYKHVTVEPISGTGREVIMGSVPEGIWTDCCAILNELSLGFNDAEVDCFKVGGYFKVCNAILEDSDIDLAATLLDAIGQAIGLALDKAILYGRNAAGTMKMPQGIVSRLVQTSEPAGYPATARPWVDLHSSNVLTIANSVTGIDLFRTLLLDSSVINGKYARGQKVWVMNEVTRTYLMAQAMSVNAAGAIVSGVENTMPVIGGIIEVLEFIPNYVIIGGYFELYLLAERAGKKFASSEHAFFIQDQTAFKGTARYDGVPVIAEAFAAIGVNSVTPNATMAFAPDVANDAVGIILSNTAVSVAASATKQLKATTVPGGQPVTFTSSDTTKATVDSTGKITGVAAGSAVITATSGSATAVCNVTVTSS